MVTAPMKLKDPCSLEEKLLKSILKSRDIALLTKVHLVKAMVFGVKLKTLESPFDSKEIKPVNPKGNQS